MIEIVLLEGEWASLRRRELELCEPVRPTGEFAETLGPSRGPGCSTLARADAARARLRARAVAVALLTIAAGTPACTPDFDTRPCATEDACAPGELCIDGACAFATTLAPLDVTGAAAIVVTIREPSRPPRVLAWNVAADLDLTQLAPPISPHASVHALLYACGLEAFELAEGALPEGTALEPPGAVVRYEHASRMWSPRATADALSTIEAESELRFDLDPCPAYAHVATATTGWSFDEPWLVALFDDVVGLGTPGGHFATYSNGRLHREPNQQLACAWGNGVEAWALDVDGCPGRLAPPHTFTRDLELPCNTMVATGRCVGLLALPGSTELVAATRPAGVARMDRNEWRELVDPRTFLPPARGFFALDRRPSEILFAYRHAFDGIGFTMSWTDGVSTEIQLPMAIEDTYAITALASDDFIIGAQGPGLVTLYQYRSGALTRIGEITQELITALAPARAGFLAVTTYGVRHFASGRECGLWPIEDAWRAVETTSGIVVLRRSGESVELVELHRTRPARGCFPRELARPSR